MQLAGHTAAQSSQATQMIIPSGSRASSCSPRKRGNITIFCSGYWMVMGRVKKVRKVNFNPFSNGSIIRLLAKGSSPLFGEEDQAHGGEQDVHQSQGEENFPSEFHQLVIPETGKGGPNPDEEKDETEHLDQKPENGGQEGALPSAEEEGNGERAHHQDVGILAQVI